MHPETDHVSVLEETEGGVQSMVGGLWWDEFQKYFCSPVTDVGFGSHCRLLRIPARVWRQGPQRQRCVPRNSHNIKKLNSQQELERICNECQR